MALPYAGVVAGNYKSPNWITSVIQGSNNFQLASFRGASTDSSGATVCTIQRLINDTKNYIAKIDKNGFFQWSAYTPSVAFVTVASGSSNIYAALYSLYDSSLSAYVPSYTKFDYNGNVLVSKKIIPQYASSSVGFNSSTMNDIAVDSSDNLYFLYTLPNSAGGLALAVTKITASSNTIAWTQVIQNSTTSSASMYGAKIKIDSVGKVYVLCAVGTTYYTIKLNVDGSIIWQRYFSRDAGYLGSIDLAISNASGIIYICGVYNLGQPPNAGFIAAYDANGVKQWIKTYAYASSNATQFTSIAIDSSDNLYVGGSHKDTSYSFGALFKISSTGTLLYTRVFTNASPSKSQGSISVTGLYNNNIIMGGGVLVDSDTTSNTSVPFFTSLPQDGTKIGTYRIGANPTWGTETIVYQSNSSITTTTSALTDNAGALLTAVQTPTLADSGVSVTTQDTNKYFDKDNI